MYFKNQKILWDTVVSFFHLFIYVLSALEYKNLIVKFLVLFLKLLLVMLLFIK